ncbi:unnamed protein product, partial [Meganyctiphanes norvegica]
MISEQIQFILGGYWDWEGEQPIKNSCGHKAAQYYCFALRQKGRHVCLRYRFGMAGYPQIGSPLWLYQSSSCLFHTFFPINDFVDLSAFVVSSATAGGEVTARSSKIIMFEEPEWQVPRVFVPDGVNTLPEYTHKRFGGRRIQRFLAVLSLILYIFTKISVNMYSGAIFIQQALRMDNIYIAIIFLLIVTALCTVLGGLAAVIYTDTLQFFIMISGSIYVLVRGLQEVGGYSELQTKYLASIPNKLVGNTTCGLPRVDSWRMLRDADTSVSDMPWPGFFLGQTPSSIWYWCADQMMVQRVMASRSLSHAQGATLFAGYAKLLPLFIMVIPGMISRVLFPNEVGCIDPDECFKFCGSRTSCSNSAYPKLVLEYMPSGMRGVMFSVMLAALMSDLTSIFNSASTLFTMDIWSYYQPKAKPREQILVGRLFIIVLAVAAILWVPVIERNQGGQMYIYIQAVAAYLSPPIAAMYCLAIFWKRMNESGAFWGLMSGFFIGIVRMLLDFYYGEPACYEEEFRPAFLSELHYMYFAMLLFISTIVVSVVVTLMTKPPEGWMLIRTTFCTRYDCGDRDDDLELKEHAQNELLQDINEREHHDLKHISHDQPWYKRIYNCMCGYDNSEKAQEQAEAMKEHIANLTNLEQTKCEKVILNTMLIIIISVAIIAFVVLSINPFTIEEVYEIQRTKLEELGLFGLL